MCPPLGPSRASSRCLHGSPSLPLSIEGTAARSFKPALPEGPSDLLLLPPCFFLHSISLPIPSTTRPSMPLHSPDAELSSSPLPASPLDTIFRFHIDEAEFSGPQDDEREQDHASSPRRRKTSQHAPESLIVLKQACGLDLIPRVRLSSRPSPSVCSSPPELELGSRYESGCSSPSTMMPSTPGDREELHAYQREVGLRLREKRTLAHS